MSKNFKEYFENHPSNKDGNKSMNSFSEALSGDKSKKKSGQKNRVTKTVNLYSYLRFCGNIMCTAGQNENMWLTKATGMDTNGCGMLTDSNWALFLDSGGVVGPHRGKRKKWRFCNYGIFGDKNHRFHLPAGYRGVQ